MTTVLLLLGTFTVPTGTNEEYWTVFQLVGGELITDGNEDALNQLVTNMNAGFEAARLTVLLAPFICCLIIIQWNRLIKYGTS